MVSLLVGSPAKFLAILLDPAAGMLIPAHGWLAALAGVEIDADVLATGCLLWTNLLLQEDDFFSQSLFLVLLVLWSVRDFCLLNFESFLKVFFYCQYIWRQACRSFRIPLVFSPSPQKMHCWKGSGSGLTMSPKAKCLVTALLRATIDHSPGHMITQTATMLSRASSNWLMLVGLSQSSAQTTYVVPASGRFWSFKILHSIL